MAAEVQRLFRETDVLRQGIFSMGGHEDGIVAFGQTVAAAGNTLLTMLTRAQQLQQ
jgi:L-ribulose-5-phosphate 4-epimerase